MKVLLNAYLNINAASRKTNITCECVEILDQVTLSLLGASVQSLAEEGYAALFRYLMQLLAIPGAFSALHKLYSKQKCVLPSKKNINN